MRAKQKRRQLLLQWRREQYESISAKELADSLSVENLRWDPGIPIWLAQSLKEFRKLRVDRRVAACRAFLAA